MSEKEKIEMLAELLEVEAEDLTAETVLDDLDEWDSLSKLSLMSLVKKKWNKSLTVDEIRTFVTIGDICNYIG